MSITRKMIRFATRTLLGSKSRRRKLLVGYLIGLSPLNYLTTGLSTGANITNPQQVLSVMQNTQALSSISGIANTLTGGVLKPVVSASSVALGSATEFVGSKLGIDNLENSGAELVSYGTQWFNAGKDAVSNTISSISSKTNTPENTTATNATTTTSSSNVDFDSSKYPDFYAVTGEAQFGASDYLEAGKTSYSELDNLGRTLQANGTITWAMVQKSAGTREKFEKGSDPSGWGHNKKIAITLPNGKVYHGYAWNRSHLIADSLGGRAFRQNLITGTRMQNVGANNSQGGMQYIERKTINYLKSHKDKYVYYKVTPIYDGDNSVPTYVDVDALSSDGVINEHVRTFNVLPGYNIDYYTGEISKQ